MKPWQKGIELDTLVEWSDKFEEYNFKVWEKSLSGNLSSNFAIIKSVSKYMLKKKAGSIINIASDVGIISPDHRIYKPNKKTNPRPYKP